MMEINLLPPKNVLSQKERQLQRVLLILASVTTVIFVAILVGLLLWKNQVSSALSAKSAEQQQLLATLSGKEDQARKWKAIDAKLQAISVVRKNQVDFGKRIDLIFSLPSSPASVRSMAWASGASVRTEFLLPNATDTEALLTKLGHPDEVPELSQIVVSSLHGTSDQTFNFGLTARYKEALALDPIDTKESELPQ